MKAIILAAGIGKRLLPLTKEIPKALLKIRGRTILEHQIKILNECGVKDIIVVVGHGADKVKELIGNKAKCIFNPKYDTTNNIYSQWVARDEIRNNDCLCMHGDALFHIDILKNIIKHKGDICLAVQEKDEREMIRVKVKDGLVTEINKPISFEEAYGNFIGISKYSAGISERLIKETEKFIRDGKTDVFYPIPINGLIKEGVKVYPVSTKGLPWGDVDDKDDLDIAKNKIFPLILKD